jgi:hypothetical protein
LSDLAGVMRRLTIFTAFVESAVDQVLSKRLVKKQQMSWSRRGAHLLLQVRIRALNEELREKFDEWCPGFNAQSEGQARAAWLPRFFRSLFHPLIEDCNERASANRADFPCLSNKIAENDGQWGGKFRTVGGNENSMIRT